jgi:hypothetical protein
MIYYKFGITKLLTGFEIKVKKTEFVTCNYNNHIVTVMMFGI